MVPFRPILCLSIIIPTSTLLQFSPPISGASTDDNDRPSYHNCGSGDKAYSYSAGSQFEQTLNDTLYTHLTADATDASRTYANITNDIITNGTSIDRVYALYFCRGDIDAGTCQNCVQDAVQEIVQKCKFKKQGIVWYDFCTLRYANHSIFSLDEDKPHSRYYNRTNLVSKPNLEPHRQLFSSTMDDVVVAAANDDNATASGYFYEKEATLSSSLKLRGLAQCSPLIGNRLCASCVRVARNRLDLWANTMVFHPSCNFKFELYGHPRPPSSSPPGGSDRKKTIILAVLLPIVAILILVGGCWFWKRSQSPDIEKTTKETTPPELGTINADETRLQLARFTYSDVKDMTNEFSKTLGEGGYGVVYYGRLKSDNKEIAVKVLEKIDAPKQFSNEINVLGRIHHKNLVSLIGYCKEGTSNLALIYEYMPGGDLKALMSEHSDAVVSWKSRIAIAFDMAQGLEYLHTGCSPSIVHRDVKPANILLDNNLRAKVADFGLSKIFPLDYISQLETSQTTRVIGTPGYVDPQYQSTGRVTEKSDVYSYGVVLLELITGKTAIMKSTSTHLVQWVMPLYQRGDIGSILDTRLRVEVGENYMTVWKATELAMNCVEPDEKDRPTMSLIATELRECLARENVEAGSPISLGTHSMEMMTPAAVSTTSTGPQPR